MLKHLQLKNVGPAPELGLEFSPRVNVITGDNGLGKSFLLDIAWWAMTRKWPNEINNELASGFKARPTDPKLPATISFNFSGKSKDAEYESEFKRDVQDWTGPPGRPPNPGLLLYAQADGSFAAWDPARNYWKNVPGSDVQERPPAFVFSQTEIWNGLVRMDSVGTGSMKLCNGLIADWAGWQKENGSTFDRLRKVLTSLSPSRNESIEPGPLTRISLDDVSDITTLKMPYGQSVPVLHASAGMRRIIALAYLLVWCWEEHVRAREILGQETTSQVVFLIDEIESHLHPKWQRVIIRALLAVMNSLTSDAEVQLIVTTHSPLLLASMEPQFDPNQDSWFDLDLVGDGGASRVELTKRDFVRHGNVSNWLTSEAFDLKNATSLEYEGLMEEAAVAMSDEAFDAAAARSLEGRLHGVLGDADPFWIRWRYVAERKGWSE